MTSIKKLNKNGGNLWWQPMHVTGYNQELAPKLKT